jgi:hypothetical protein
MTKMKMGRQNIEEMSEDDKEERIDMLNEAQRKLAEAIELIGCAVQGTEYEASADAYILGHLRAWMDGDNKYDTTSIPRLIERFTGEESD